MTPTTYSGRCHCGAVRFTFQSQPITAALRCNCSMCIRKGILLTTTYVTLTSVEGRDQLTVYRFGDRLLDHAFCRTCGIATFSELTQEPNRCRVNLGCVDGLDPLALPVSIVDGKAL